MKNEELINRCLEKGICLDNFIGTIEGKKANLNFSKSKRKKFIERNSIDDIVNNGNKNVVIVLESPHTDEYKYANENFVAPAIGRTGVYLQKWFHICINEYLPSNEKYNVILMNAVQYQCSLGVKPQEYRDKLWCELWFNYNKKDDFIKRLNHYNPYIIVNACTIGTHIVPGTSKQQKPNLKYIKGIIQESSIYDLVKEKVNNITIKDKYSLKGYIEIEITNNLSTKYVKLLHSSHPSSWYIKGNRKIE